MNSRSEKLYEKFLIEYATCEDKIRSLWAQLLEEHEKLYVRPIRTFLSPRIHVFFKYVQVIEHALHEKHEKAAARHEGQEVEALSKIHTAFEGQTPFFVGGSIFPC